MQNRVFEKCFPRSLTSSRQLSRDRRASREVSIRRKSRVWRPRVSVVDIRDFRSFCGFGVTTKNTSSLIVRSEGSVAVATSRTPSPGEYTRPDSITQPIAVSVLLPVVDETTSLQRTVEMLLEENASAIHEILIVVCGKTTPEALAIAASLAAAHPDLLRVKEQSRPYLGGAMRDAFEWATGTHVLMMASDLETDPRTVKPLIETATQGFDVVTATRWTKEGGFEGYSPLKFVLNWVFQNSFRALYGTSLTDLTYGFRIFKAEWVKTIRWEELRHPFLLETILKPLRLGARVAETPTVWKTRSEGQSHNTFWQNFVYFRTALRNRFTSKTKLLREGF